MNSKESPNYLLHIIVVGFHHKKGCQVEYCFPNISTEKCEDGISLPQEWKVIPTLALPDGAHNYEKDTIYFIVPAAGEDSTGVVYGISCYRQMDSSMITNRTADITRSSVQKSVVVLSTVPLFGAIRTRLEVITQAYFEEADFSKVEILEDAFRSLSYSLTPGCLKTHLHTDLPARELLLRYKVNLLVLFKLLLLERRVLFFMSPAEELTTVMVTLLSLFPELLSSGLTYCTQIDDSALSIISCPSSENLEGFPTTEEPGVSSPTTGEPTVSAPSPTEQETRSVVRSESAGSLGYNGAMDNEKLSSGPGSIDARSRRSQPGGGAVRMITQNVSAAGSFFRSRLLKGFSGAPSTPEKVVTSDDIVEGAVPLQSDPILSVETETTRCLPTSPLTTDEWGFPLAIFTKSSLFYPYVSLHYLDLVENPSVRCFVLGASNMLFKRKHLVDAIIGADDTSISIQGEGDLRRHLQLTNADLRFIDMLISVVMETTVSTPGSSSSGGGGSRSPSEERVESSEGRESPAQGRKRHAGRRKKHRRKHLLEDDGQGPPGWFGSDDWLRAQFRSYMQTLLLSAVDARPSCEDFNSHFVRALRRTHWFRVWRGAVDVPTLCESMRAASPAEVPGTEFEEPPEPWEHPGHRQWQLGDIRLRMNHLLSATEQGRKLNSAVQQTGKMMSDTTKVVGGALNQARSAVTSFWSGISRGPPHKSPTHNNNNTVDNAEDTVTSEQTDAQVT